MSAGVVRVLEHISRDPPERDTVSAPSLQSGTTLVRTGLSLDSDRSDLECSSSSLGHLVNLSSVSTSSNLCQPNSVASSYYLASAPVKVSCDVT